MSGAQGGVLFFIRMHGMELEVNIESEKKDIGKSSPVDDCTAAFTKAI